MGDDCDWFFSWEKGFGPFRCYFYDLVYFGLCLGNCLVAFYIILETKLYALGDYYFWSFQALETTFGWLSGQGYAFDWRMDLGRKLEAQLAKACSHFWGGNFKY